MASNIYENAIYYEPVFRTYAIRYNINYKTDTGRISMLDYCPWCKSRIPSSLNKKCFEVLEKEYGISNPDLDDFTNVPEEFQTDAWWKKRGL